MSTFVQKLIEDTRNGELDFVWKYSPSAKYTFFFPKHPMNGMYFDLGSLEKKQTEVDVVFANGGAESFPLLHITLLEKEIRGAISRANEEIMKNYIGENIAETQEESQNEENTQEEEDGTTEENK